MMARFRSSTQVRFDIYCPARSGNCHGIDFVTALLTESTDPGELEKLAKAKLTENGWSVPTCHL